MFLVAGWRPVAAGTPSARASAPPPSAVVVAQATPSPAAPAPPVVAPTPGRQGPIGLPPVREYEATAELRDVYFDFGKAVIRASDVNILDANAAWLRAHPDQLVLIEGHCDNRGVGSVKNEFNMALGEQRAQAAMNHLVAKGVHPSRITIISYGEERPVCAVDDEPCWRQNRRARFLVKPR